MLLFFLSSCRPLEEQNNKLRSSETNLHICWFDAEEREARDDSCDLFVFSPLLLKRRRTALRSSASETDMLESLCELQLCDECRLEIKRV